MLDMKGTMNVNYNKWFTKGMKVEFVKYDEFGVLGQYVYVRNELNQVMPVAKNSVDWE